MALAEPSDQSRVDGISLRAEQLALRECFDACRIDHAHAVLEIVKIERQRLPIRARGLRANTDVVDPPVSKPRPVVRTPLGYLERPF